jgi:hypothetical protein
MRPKLSSRRVLNEVLLVLFMIAGLVIVNSWVAPHKPPETSAKYLALFILVYIVLRGSPWLAARAADLIFRRQ